MSSVIPFPTRAPAPPEDFVGPAVGTDAWACNRCDDDDTKFMFYVRPSGVYCWTCHHEQTFP
jgi:hypothetical protein